MAVVLSFRIRAPLVRLAFPAPSSAPIVATGDPTTYQPEIDDALRARLKDLCAEGWAFFERFDREVREREFHSFIASEYEVVLDALIAHSAPGPSGPSGPPGP